MKFFDRIRSRNKQQDASVLPAEVNQYYTSEQDGRRGVAFVLGIITLIITLVVASGLFLAGRYVYRKVAQDDKPTTTQTGTLKNDTKTQDKANTSTKDNNAKNKKNPSPNPSGAQPSPSTPSPSPSTLSPSTPGTSTSPSSSMPNTGDEPSALPNTGDDPQ